jgi:3-hydroxyisobutyrate dehydrogenase-like beta-hydroxyacid dehydrogenase
MNIGYIGLGAMGGALAAACWAVMSSPSGISVTAR